jgi:hypothetical protein
MNASPAKRRVLAPLDANVQSPGVAKTSQLGLDKPLLLRDVQNSVTATDEPAAKRQCLSAPSSFSPTIVDDRRSENQDRECSASPEPCSFFDNSAVDTSEATCTTEPDTEVPIVSPPRPRRRPTITRGEARQRAETLRLRLGLAGYKLRTGQEDVPLERLQARRVPNKNTNERRLASHIDSYSGSTLSRERQAAPRVDDLEKTNATSRDTAQDTQLSPDKYLLPRLSSVSFHTPTRMRFDGDEGLTSSAMKGGAAKGLLRLSRG